MTELILPFIATDSPSKTDLYLNEDEVLSKSALSANGSYLLN